MVIVEVAGFVALAALLFSIETVINWLERRKPIGSILKSEAGDTSTLPASTVPSNAPGGQHHASAHHGGFGDHGGFGGHGGFGDHGGHGGFDGGHEH